MQSPWEGEGLSVAGPAWELGPQDLTPAQQLIMWILGKSQAVSESSHSNPTSLSTLKYFSKLIFPSTHVLFVFFFTLKLLQVLLSFFAISPVHRGRVLSLWSLWPRSSGLGGRAP